MERESDWPRIPHNRLECHAHFFHPHRRRNRTEARRSNESYMRWLVPRKLGIVPLVYLADSLAYATGQLSENEDSIQHQSLGAIPLLVT
jgi:hypothetical protein